MLGAAQAGGRLRAQSDRDGDALVVGEQQRRQAGARLEPVAAGAAAHGLDAVAELAQALDVAAQGAVADVEALDEFARRPVPVALQQGEEFEGPRGGGGHVPSISAMRTETVRMARKTVRYDEPDDHRQGLTKTFRSKGRPSRPSVPSTSPSQEGELVAFLGPNGAGKSTTLRMLTTLLPPTSGDAIVAGCDIRRDPAGVRRRIGYVGQGNSGGHTQRVRDELHAQGAFYGIGRRETRARAAELIESLELGQVADRAGAVALGRPEAPARHRARAHPPARAAVPRRAVDRTRPA